MARVPQLKEFVKKHDLKIITIAELIKYRKRTEKLVERTAETVLPTKYGTFKLIAFESQLDKQCHIALVKGEVHNSPAVLTRVHSECLTG